jgi:hypothetical protein
MICPTNAALSIPLVLQLGWCSDLHGDTACADAPHTSACVQQLVGSLCIVEMLSHTSMLETSYLPCCHGSSFMCLQWRHASLEAQMHAESQRRSVHMMIERLHPNSTCNLFLVTVPSRSENFLNTAVQ